MFIGNDKFIKIVSSNREYAEHYIFLLIFRAFYTKPSANYFKYIYILKIQKA